MSDSACSLIERYDLLLLDLDGVVYRGPEAVPGAPDQLLRARDAGAELLFVTNNAARTPEQVAQHLTELGIVTGAGDVVTSAQAAAGLLAARLPAGAPVFLLGGEGLRAACLEVGLTPVTDPDAAPQAVVSGFGPQMPWQRAIDGAILINAGLPWVAANTDGSFPTERGLAPGHGALVELLSRFTGVTPSVAGKPDRPLFDEALRRFPGARALMIGDRLDTDIAGARAAGLDSLLVLTGVDDLDAVAAAPQSQRPTFVGTDLGALFEPVPHREGDQAPARLGALASEGRGTVAP
ncbi:HAD-IIA family hydrolase [Nocardioides sp. Bht2]|uniref:HAD-IIA family hydrolase n=1 Tax=Nocardioides sp. Bht2 TaxID=3392297 RepID=UPI0039B58702